PRYRGYADLNRGRVVHRRCRTGNRQDLARGAARILEVHRRGTDAELAGIKRIARISRSVLDSQLDRKDSIRRAIVRMNRDGSAVSAHLQSLWIDSDRKTTD